MENKRVRFAGSKSVLNLVSLPAITNTSLVKVQDLASRSENSPMMENKKGSKHGMRMKNKLAGSVDLYSSPVNPIPRILHSRTGVSLDKLLNSKRKLSQSPVPVTKPNATQRVTLLALEHIPRVIETLASKSVTGSVNGRVKKANQDSLFVIQNFNESRSQTLIGVMDGHGIFGEQVSSFIKTYLPVIFSKKTQDQLKNLSLYPLSDSDQNTLSQKISEAFQLTHMELCKNSNIDTSFSGSTAVTVLIRGKDCVCSNVGDSRAVLGRFCKNSWEAVALSKDHKPDDALERARIERMNGRIEAFKDSSGKPVGPLRVWLKNEQYPGLAMSRSIGDTVSNRAGVTCVPDVFFYTLHPNDRFIILASDGIWEFISNEESVQIVSNFYFSGKLSEACDQLVKIATYRWRQKDVNIDDITVVIVSLKVKE